MPLEACSSRLTRAASRRTLSTTHLLALRAVGITARVRWLRPRITVQRYRRAWVQPMKLTSTTTHRRFLPVLHLTHAVLLLVDWWPRCMGLALTATISPMTQWVGPH